MTAKKIIEGALRTIGVLASGEEGQPSELQDAFDALNGMIGSWNNDGFMIPNVVQRQFTLGNKSTYTYGPGGDFDATRPMNIIFAQFKDQGSYYYPIDVVGVNQWAINVRPAVIRPIIMYFEPAYPLANVHFPTIPFSTDSLVLQVVEPLTKLDNITDNIDLPDGYDRALKLNLAVELSAEYNGNLRPETVQLAQDAKNQIKIKNARVQSLTFDFTTATGVYNIIQGPVK